MCFWISKVPIILTVLMPLSATQCKSNFLNKIQLLEMYYSLFSHVSLLATLDLIANSSLALCSKSDEEYPTLSGNNGNYKLCRVLHHQNLCSHQLANSDNVPRRGPPCSS